MKSLLHRSDEMARRQFALRAARAFLGLSVLPQLPSKVHAEAAGGGTAKNIIYLFMSGGMSHIDTLDPKPGSEVQAKTGVIKTKVPGIQLGEYMTNVAQHMDKCAIVRSINSTQGAHTEGRYFMRNSYAKRGTIIHPSLGAWINKFSDRQDREIPDYVIAGGNPKSSRVGFLESKYSPLPIANPSKGLEHSKIHNVTQARFDHRMNLAAKLDAAYQERYNRKDVRAYTDMYTDAIRLMQSRELEVFDLNKESNETRNKYGSDSFGQGCLLARRLVEADVRFIEVGLDGWDNHYEIYDRLPERASRLDAVLGTLLEDLNSRGLLDHTLVVVATEFGRTPKINPRAGRDHYPRAFSCLLAGGGVQGGVAYGETDEHASEVVENKVSVPDFNATIAHLAGMPLDEIVYSPSGRPFTLADDGKPILDIV